MSESKVEEILRDIKEHPERHRHDFDGLQRCCMVEGRAILRIMDAHEGLAGANVGSGRRCDVSRGPCSCGAWH